MKNLLLFVLICTVSCYYGFAGIEPSDTLRRTGGIVGETLLERAKSGDAESQDLLGEAYIHGNIIPGIPRDESQGFYWLEKAASQKYPKAINGLAICYANGLGVQKDLRKAHDLFLEAADLGYVNAQVYVGNFFISGTYGFPKAPDRGFEYFKKAADQGSLKAQATLGMLYYHGVGVAPNEETAKTYFLSAARQGDFFSQAIVDSLDACSHGEILSWYESRLQESSGSADVLYHLGKSYFYGRGCCRDPDKGIKFLKRASFLVVSASSNAEQYAAVSSMMLLILIQFERGEAWLSQTEIDLYERYISSSLPSLEARLCLAICALGRFDKSKPKYEDGEKIHETLEAILSKGDSVVLQKNRHFREIINVANHIRGICALNGYGISLNTSQGLQLLEASACSGYKKSQQKLSEIYGEGKLISKDSEKAAYWHNIAEKNVAYKVYEPFYLTIIFLGGNMTYKNFIK
ncbi:MAG: sel1 repeat family protein [Opitutales bacterium]|nr:sel1 repeat family protein [Opitutales bacterium]